MTKRSIVYIVVFLSTVYLSLLYDGYTMRFLIAFEIVFPAFLFVILFAQRKYTDVVLTTPVTSVARHEDIVIEFKISQKNIVLQKLFPLHNIMIKAKCTDTGNVKKLIRRKFEPGSVEGNGKIAFSGMTSNYGMVDISVDDIMICDYMNLFALRFPCSCRSEVYVMPESDEALVSEIENLRNSRSSSFGNMLMSVLSDSQDDLKELRDYREGDHIKRIHWKVSAKMDRLMVREYEGNASSRVFVLVDGINAADRNEWIERVFLICRAVAEDIGTFDIGWLFNGKYIKHKVRGADKMVNAMCSFLKAQQRNEIDDSRNRAYNTDVFDKEYEAVVGIDTKGILSINGERLA